MDREKQQEQVIAQSSPTWFKRAEPRPDVRNGAEPETQSVHLHYRIQHYADSSRNLN